MVTNDKSRDVAGRGDVRNRPGHPDVVRPNASKLEVGGSGDGCRSRKGLKVKATTHASAAKRWNKYK